jgi:ketosteroid isomerase-like protein
MCRKLFLLTSFVLVFVFAFSTMAMASDIAFYVGQWNTDGWYDETQFADVETIIAETGSLFMDIQQFDDTQFDEFGAWVDENTNDGEMDIIWLNGCTPSVLYPNPNEQPDGSRAEEWLDGGNMIINVGDWFAYCTYEGGPRGGEGRGGDNGGDGAANILDLSSGIIFGADGTQLTVTPTGKEYLPSLNDPAKTDRPVALAAVEAPWEVAAIFASPGGTDDAAAEAHADPLVIHNTETGGYVAFINQASGGPDGWIADRGLTSAEFIGNWVNSVIGLGAAPAALPEGWQNQDIDTTGGSAAESDGTWTISADGADIWGNSDQFHYVYRELTGDAVMIARVVDNGTGSNTWAKGGVMIRQSLDGDSINVFGAITGGSGDGGTFQWRSVQGESSGSSQTLTGIAPPYYVRLVREGNTFTAYMSADGVDWAQEGADPVTIEMTDPVLIGLAVTSHAAGEVRTYTFDNVRVVSPDVIAIEEVLNQYAVYANAGDLESWLSLHADDVVKMPPDAPAIFGIEDLRANFKPAFDDFDTSCVIYPEEAHVDGDLGYARGTYSISITPKAGGETISLMPDGKYLTILKRQPDGSWKISHDCYNSNVPPTPPPVE